MKTTSLLSCIISMAGVAAQDASPFSIFNQTGRLPFGCVNEYSAGTDTTLYTVPYTYAQVMSVIGSYRNLTWSGVPEDAVSLNGTDNTVGTARTYDTGGIHVVETITVYQKPTGGPYEEIHTLAPVTIPTEEVSFYSDYERTTVFPICNGAATTFDFTIDFCASNATLAANFLRTLHLTGAQTVGTLLGNQNFISCAAMTSTSTSNSTTSNLTTTTGSPSAIAFTGGASILTTNVLIAWAGMLGASVVLVAF